MHNREHISKASVNLSRWNWRVYALVNLLACHLSDAKSLKNNVGPYWIIPLE